MFRNFINFREELNLFYKLTDIINHLKKIKPGFVFFSENKTYQKFSKQILDSICAKYNDQIYYFSIDKNDKIENEKVNNYYLNPLLMRYFFKNISCSNLFLTLTDLGNNFTTKTKNVDNYVYYFHSPVSTTKNYKHNAFDNYDSIMCIGQFQIDEIRSRENIKKLPEKKLIPSGYFYFDYLIENINHENSFNDVLIAPSWNRNLKNFINENFVDLTEVLLKKNFGVIFRPHPEHFKHSKNIIKKIENKFSTKNFKLDINRDNINSMEKARCLITDSSGIAIEYIIALKRPILYLNEHDKVHNIEFKSSSKLDTIDHKIKENFGNIFEKSDFNQIDTLIIDSEKILSKKLPALNKLINDYYFNVGYTKTYLDANLSKHFKF
jgi:YidC/Oxa1 family membrane protein insertase